GFPPGFPPSLARWETIDVVNITGDTLTVLLQAESTSEYVLADSILIDRLGDIPAGPEVVVVQNNRNASAGTIDYGTTQLQHPLERTFSITNSGTSDLTITSAVTLIGPNALAFELVSGPAAGTVVAPGGSADFVVRLTAAYEGVKNATIAFTTDDVDEGTVNLPITANVLNYRIIDDQDPAAGGYSESGTWAYFAGPYYQGDTSVANTEALQGPASASWTFTNVSPGTYYAALTWFDTAGNTAYASNTPVSIWDGSLSEGFFFLNQQQGPTSFAFDGVMWQLLHFFVVDSNGSLPTTVTLVMSNAGADGLILADGAIIARVGGPGEIPPGNGAQVSGASLQLSGKPEVYPTAPQVNESLVNSIYWNEELDEVAILLAGDSAEREADGLTVDSPPAELPSETEAIDLALSEW
ncbi:MAG: choice-of-anchor D domain-containing protein, partial [Planctomycetes bacterium]|nr:choice-of-anchor D domain-containing protein [Planctomycetota bacterium]